MLAAASLARHCQPLAVGLVCAFTGWKAVCLALGAGAGYLLFWGSAGYQGLLWLGLALPVALVLGKRQIVHESVYLMSGAYDLAVFVEDKTLQQVSRFVSERISTFDGVISTATHFILKKYKDHGTVLSRKDEDEREKITP